MSLSSRLFLALSVAPLLVAQTKYQTDLLAMSPLGFWPLNGDANDVSTHGNNGTPMNGLFFTSLFTSPVEPKAAVFTSPKDHFISMPGGGSSIFNLGALHAMTAMAWIKTTSQGNGFVTILGKFDPAVRTGWGIGIDNSDAIAPQNGGRFVLLFQVSGNITLAVEATIPVNDGRWHLVAATYDGSGTAIGVRLYLDGNYLAAPIVAADAIGSSSILNSAPLTIGAAPDGTQQFEGNISGAAVFGVALTPAQLRQLADDAASANAILGQFVFGGGWYSAVYFSNAGLNEVSFPASFTGDSGIPLNIPSIGASSKAITLPPGGSAVIEALNVGSQIQQGYVSVVLPIGVTAYGVFRQSVPGVADQEAVVPLVYSGASNQTLVYDETKFVTAVAIVNPSSVVTSVTITIEGIDGNVIATSSSPVVLQPFSKTEAALRSLPGLSPIVGKQGLAKFSVSTGAVVVLGLRFNGVAFTSIPALSQKQLFEFPGATFF
ncbi:MAG: LamG domain-containing protein [Acidobacteriia bacterium]|nr:LamG domain-containing protein [Terriglobia bacterium]